MSGSPISVLVTGPDIEQSGGAGVQMHVRYLAQVFESDPCVRVIPFAATSTRYDESMAVKVIRTLTRWIVFPRWVMQAEVVHVNTSIDTRSFARDCGFVVLARLCGRPVLLQYHGGGVHRVPWATRGVMRVIVRSILRIPVVTLFLSQEQMDPMCSAFELERVVQVRNYVPVPDGIAKDGTPHPLRVLFMSRIEESKGVIESMDAFERSASAGWEMRIAGSGSAVDAVIARAKTVDGVRFLGFVEGDERDGLMDWADVLVLPSDHDEGLPYSVLEAAARGCAIIASSRGALSSVVIDGETGIIIPPRDASALALALEVMGSDPDTLHRMGSAARALVEKEFSFRAMHTRFSMLYADAAASR